MTVLRSLLVALATLVLFVAAPAAAQHLSPQDRNAVAHRAKTLEGMIASGEFGGIFELMPPRVKAVLTERSGLTEQQLKDGMNAVLVEMQTIAVFETYAIDLTRAVEHRTPDGSRAYLLIPTETVLAYRSGGRLRTRAQTVAIQDGGQWYLLRLDQPEHVAFFREAYPEFVGVDFPPSTVDRLP